MSVICSVTFLIGILCTRLSSLEMLLACFWKGIGTRVIGVSPSSCLVTPSILNFSVACTFFFVFFFSRIFCTSSKVLVLKMLLSHLWKGTSVMLIGMSSSSRAFHCKFQCGLQLFFFFFSAGFIFTSFKVNSGPYFEAGEVQDLRSNPQNFEHIFKMIYSTTSNAHFVAS